MDSQRNPVLEQSWAAAALLPAAPAPRLQQRLKKVIGASPIITGYLGPLEWLHELIYRSFTSPPEKVPSRWRDVAKFVTSQENCCRVCFGAQRAYMQVIGYEPSWIDRLERDVQSGALDPTEQAIADFCRKLSRSNPRPAVKELQALIDLGVSREQAAELVCVVGLTCCNNRLATFMAIPPEKTFEWLGTSWWAAPLRKLMARRMLALDAGAGPVTGGVGGSFERVLRPLAHLQWGPLLAQVLRDAQSSGVISARTKLLMICVVARALGCRTCTEDTERTLAELGLDASQVADIVQRLGAGGTDSTEEALLRFARETLRYEPRAIQLRVEQLIQQIGPEATREAIAVTGIANMLVRIGMFSEC